MVVAEGVEPSILSASGFESDVYTSSTTLLYGAPARIRTADLMLTRQLLYLLSYWGFGAGDRVRTCDNQLGRLTFYH
jgi:hypothetical protein